MAPSERILVEIERDSEPISGLVRRVQAGAADSADRFRGYIELIAAPERASGGGDDRQRAA